MVFKPTSATINFTPVGYMASPSGGTGRATGKIRPSVGTPDWASVAPVSPMAVVFRNARREWVIVLYQAVIASSNNVLNSSGPAGRGESLVTRCCGSVPSTSFGISDDV